MFLLDKWTCICICSNHRIVFLHIETSLIPNPVLTIYSFGPLILYLKYNSEANPAKAHVPIVINEPVLKSEPQMSSIKRRDLEPAPPRIQPQMKMEMVPQILPQKEEDNSINIYMIIGIICLIVTVIIISIKK